MRAVNRAGTPAGPPRPTPADVLSLADRVKADLAQQRSRWDSGFTRRGFLAGSGMVLAATLGSQLVTTRVAYAAPGASNGKTLVVVFLRGGMDGLATVVPANDPAYTRARPKIGIPTGSLLPLDSRFGLHPAASALHPYWLDGRLAMVHAVGSPYATHSHFQAQDVVERGTGTGSTTSGWLERAVELSGPGTTFRAVCEGFTPAMSLAGADGVVTMVGLDSLQLLDGSPAVTEALSTLYTGVNDPLGDHGLQTLSVLSDAAALQQSSPKPAAGAKYPAGDFSFAMADLARVIKAGAGVRAATVDVGGWDMHTQAGGVVGSMADQLKSMSATVAAFATDLGPKLADVTVVLMSEFGRRVAENGSGGSDHGRGGVMFLLGGGVQGKKIHGAWPGVSDPALQGGDLATANDYRDVLGEAAQKTLGLGSIASVFPNYSYRPLGVMR